MKAGVDRGNQSPPCTPACRFSGGVGRRDQKVEDLGFGVRGLGFGVQGLGFSVWNLGFRVWG